MNAKRSVAHVRNAPNVLARADARHSATAELRCWSGICSPVRNAHRKSFTHLKQYEPSMVPCGDGADAHVQASVRRQLLHAAAHARED